jgi:voltage-gated potassium channel
VRVGLQSLKQGVFRQVDPSARAEGLSLTNRIVVVLIIAAVGAAMLETEPLISGGRERLFRTLELVFGITFLLEYLARLWVADLNPDFAGSRWPRLKFITSPSAIIDLVAIIPAMLAMAAGGALALRFVRFFRLLRLAKLGRFSRAWRELAAAVKARGEELLIAFSLAAFVMVVASTLLYWAEADAQPEQFGSIPRAMWWAIVTLTTVGYGDAFPVTVLGKIFSGLVLIAAIGVIALPTGIFAGAMSEVMQRKRDREQD